MNRRAALLALATLPFSRLTSSQPFESATFDSARKTGKPVLVMVHANWCPTCRKQEPAVNTLLKAPEFSTVQLFKVDFDAQEDVRKVFNVSKQSTLILFKGDKELARSTGVTQPEMIAQMLRKGL